MKKIAAFTLAVASVLVLGGHTVWAQGYYGDERAEFPGKEHAELAKSLKDVKVSLEKGILASELEGKPISGKFEVEEDKLQLSVYTMKGDTFSEVIVDHKTGKPAKVEAITDGEDLTAAKAQGEAMAKAKVSLRAAIGKAIKANQGFRAVSAIPALKDGHPVAEIILIKDGAFKTVSETLD